MLESDNTFTKCCATTHNLSIDEFIVVYHQNRISSTISPITVNGRKKENRLVKIDLVSKKLSEKQKEILEAPS